MAEKNKNQVVVLEPLADSAKELIKMLQEKNGAEILNVTNGGEALQVINQYTPCMLVCSLRETKDIPTVVGLLKGLEKLIKQGTVKTLVISKISATQLANLISGLGVTDYIMEPFPTRTVYFKSNLQLKAIEGIKKQIAQKKASEEQVVFKKSDQTGGQDAQKLKEGIVASRPSAALKNSADTFLFKKGTAKKTGKKVMLEMDGPPPETGEWVQHSDPGDPETRWRWVDEDEKESPEVKNGDGWVHTGDKPTFNETTKKWQMNSEKPDLTFHKNKTKVASKVKTLENGELEIAEDSTEAEEKLAKLQAKAKAKQEKKAALVQGQTDEKQAKVDASRLAAVAKQEETKKSEVEKKALAKEENDKTKATALMQEQKPKPIEKKELVLKKDRLKALKNKMTLGELNKEEKAEVEEIEQLVATAVAEEAVEPEAEKEEKPAKEKESREKVTPLKEEKKKDKKQSPLDFLSQKKASLGALPKEPSTTEVEAAPMNVSLTPDDPLLGVNDKRSKEIETPFEVNDKRGSTEEIENAPKVTDKSGDGENEKAAPSVRAKWSKRKNAAIADKESILRRLEQELNNPSNEELSQEEEEELLEELGEEERKEVSKEALVKRKKTKDIKAMKEQIAKMEDEFDPEASREENEHAHNTHDLSKEDPEDHWGDTDLREGDAARSKFSARDSDLEEASDKERDPKQSLRGNKEREKKETENIYLYKEEAEITPLGGVWEKAEDYFVFLDGNIRYKGFKEIEDILPVWIFSGEKIPEFIGKNKQWRFWKGEPQKCDSKTDLPIVVIDFLENLKREQEEAAKLDKKPSLDALKSKLENESEKAASTEEELAAKELADVAELLEEEKSDLDGIDLKAEFLKKNRRNRGDDDGAALNSELANEEMNAKENREASNDLNEEEADKKRKDTSTEDFLASRNSQLKELAKTEEVESSATQKVLTEEGNDSIKSFLERRKNKVITKPEAKAMAKEKNPFLAIYVAFSDSIRLSQKWEVLAPHLMQTIAGTVDSCEPYILEPFPSSESVTILVSGNEKLPAGQTIVPDGGFRKEISVPVGTDKKVLGYFYVRPNRKRKSFTDAELGAFENVTRWLASLMNKELTLTKKKVA